MTAASNRSVLDLSHREAWVVHAAILAHIEREQNDGADPTAAIDLLYVVEAGDDDFDQSQLRQLVDALSTYLDVAPAADQTPCERVLANARQALA